MRFATCFSTLTATWAFALGGAALAQSFGDSLFAPPGSEPVAPVATPTIGVAPYAEPSAPPPLAPQTATFPTSPPTPTPAPPRVAAAEVQPSAPVTGQPVELDECRVIAKIDGQIVQACEVTWQANLILAENADKIPPNQHDEVRELVMRRELMRLIDTKLLFAEFRRNVPAENWPKIEEKLRQPFEERELPRLLEQMEATNVQELEQKLHAVGTSLDDARRMFNERTVGGEWLRQNVKYNEEVTHNEMLNYYQEHLEDYEFPNQVRWEELMVRKNRFNSPRQAYAELCAMGTEVWQRAAANPDVRGPVFGQTAVEKSHGFTAQEGGVHDWTTQGALKDAAIDQALFSLEVGQLSPIIETEAGFHIVRVLERKEAGRTPFTDVQNEIREELKQERFRVAIDEFLASLRRKARVWTIFTGYTTAEALLNSANQSTTR